MQSYRGLFNYINLVVGIVLVTQSHAADRFWVAAGASNWNNTGNWSASSGGLSGASVPGVNDVAIFDGSGTGNCNIDISISVQGMTAVAGYTGTIIQASGNTITIGASGGSFSGGTFSGGDANITLNSALTISGTVFTSTSATLDLNNNYTLSSGSFTHNSGTVTLTSVDRTISGTQTFNNFTITNTGGGTAVIGAGTDLTVAGTFLLGGSNRTNINGPGTLICTGDISITNTSNANAGTGTIRLAGGANQSIVSTATLGRGELPNVEINKTGGTATFAGLVSVVRDWTYTAGTVDYATNNATVVFTNRDQTVTGAQTFENFRAHFSGGGALTVANDVTIEGTFTISNNQRINLDGPGVVICEGDISITQTANNNGGNGTIRIAGNANQSIISTATVGRGELPNVVINKTGGTATFTGLTSVIRDWTYVAGTLDYATNNATIAFTNRNQTITGVQTFENFRIHFGGGGALTMANDATVEGTFTISNNQRINLDGPGVVICEGDISITQTANNNAGNGTIRIAGTANQSIVSTATIGRGELPNVVINKTGGTATFTGLISVIRDWTYVAGTLDYATNNATIAFTNRNQTVTGVQTFENFRVHFGGGGALTMANDATVEGTFTISNNQRINLDGPGVLICEGDMALQGTSNANAGNGTIRIAGNANQSIVSTSTVGRGELPNVVINKTGGTATFTGLTSVIRDWTYIAGTLDYATNNATIAFTNRDQTVTGVQTFENFRIHFGGGGALTMANDATVEGTFTISNNQRINIDGPGVIICEGDMALQGTSNANAGSGTIRIAGNANQSIVSTSTVGRGELPNVVINKTGGTATFTGLTSVIRDWTYIAGTLDYATNNATIAFTNRDQTVTGVQTFENFRIHFGSGGALTMANDATVEGTFTISNNQRININGPGVIICEGDMALQGTSNANAGNGTIRIAGNANQSIVSTSTIGRGELPNVEINKTGGTATFTGLMSVIRDWTYTAGTMDYATNNATIAFTNRDQTVTGVQTFENLRFHFGSGGDLDMANDVTVAGTFTLSNNQRIDIDGPGIILCEGDISITQTANSNSGNGEVRLEGSANQTVTSSVGVGRGELHDITINKTGGSATFSGTLSINGDWDYQAGTVDLATNSTTVFASSAGNIDGEGTSTMEFYNLRLGTNNTRTMLGNVTVTNQLTLGDGEINLNGHTLFIDNPSAGAITRNNTNAYIISEETDNSAILRWNIGTTIGSFDFPLATTGGTNLTFTVETTAGDIGNVSIATYPTAANNTPLPVTPTAVTHVNNANSGLDNSTNTVNRFWQIDKDGPSGTANLTFRYAQAEAPSSGETNLRAQRWTSSTPSWELPGTQSSNAANNTVTADGITTFSPWAISQLGAPLPIELVSFEANSAEDLVELKWVTATEVNNDFFSVQRSNNGVDFELVQQLPGAGNSSRQIDYYTEDLAPLDGISYYRLKQTDYDGSYTYSALQAVSFIKKSFAISVYPNPVAASSGKIFLRVDATIDESDVQLFSSDGSLVSEYNGVSVSGGGYTFDSPKQPGVYYLVVGSDFQRNVTKLVVQ